MSETTATPSPWAAIDEVIQRQLAAIRPGEVITSTARYRDDDEACVIVTVTTERKARAAA